MNITEPEFRSLLHRYLQGNANEEEIKLLEDFFKSYDVEDNSHLLLPDSLKHEILSNIHERTRHRSARSRWSAAFKIAASVSVIVIAAIAASTFWKSTSNKPAPSQLTETTARGQKSIFVLPDSTVVHLNGGSSLEYSSLFSEERSVTLKGEGFFEVAHDPSHPFTVTAGNSRVVVLGTSFNVKANPVKDVEVTLVTGKVNLQAGREGIVLEPSVRAVVDSKTNRIQSARVDVEQFISWKDNVLYFEQTSLADVAETLETWYDTEIVIASSTLNTCTITGQYKDESLENVLKSIEFLVNGSVDFSDPKHVIIRGTGCKK